jgi:hypothetical protein
MVERRLAGFRGAWRSIAVVLAIVTTGAACTDQESGTDDAGESTFWSAHAVASGSEGELILSADELAIRADLIVTGKIGAVAEGKDYTEAGKPPRRTTNVTVPVMDSTTGTVSPVVVEFTRSPLVADDAAGTTLPKDDYVWYLSIWYEGEDGPVYRCTSPSYCAIGVEKGDLVTPRDPPAADQLAVPDELAAEPSFTEADLFDAAVEVAAGDDG